MEESHVQVNIADRLDGDTKALMQTNPVSGLTADEHAQRLKQFGANALVEHKPNRFLKLLGYFSGPIAWLIEAALLLTGIVQDWTDFAIIAALLVVNALIGFIEESRAESAVNALRETLALRSRCVRDGALIEVDAKSLVPGDVISLRLGDIVPADATLVPFNAAGDVISNHDAHLQIDQSALTGESLPVQKGPGALVYSSSIIRHGALRAIVAKTGSRTFIGRAAKLIERTDTPGHFQIIIGRIGNFLVIITIAMVAILLVVGLTVQSKSVLEQLANCVVITIASIPVGLPTVLSITMAVGAKLLAKKNVICKRLSAVEEMSGLTLLCSDKTGTLTKNELTVDADAIYLPSGRTAHELLRAAFMASEDAATDAIESTVRRVALARLLPPPPAEDPPPSPIPGGPTDPAVAAAAAAPVLSAREAAFRLQFGVLELRPFDPVAKLVSARVRDDAVGGAVYRVAKGAPQVVLSLCRGHGGGNKQPAVVGPPALSPRGEAPSEEGTADDGDGGDAAREIAAAEAAICAMASRGLRALAVATTSAEAPGAPIAGEPPGGGRWRLLGLLPLMDPPRDDSAATIARAKAMGVRVLMITGDQLVIAKEVARRLGLGRCLLDSRRLAGAAAAAEARAIAGGAGAAEAAAEEAALAQMAEKADGFGQVIPEEKYQVVKLLQSRGHLVGMTGDGVNDAPALKVANVGIAVAGCTDAARAAADIVLLSPGLSTIIDGLICSRQIFQRMRSYSLYRLASTIHFLLFFFITLLVWNWSLPAIQIVLICILNDAATIVIAWDAAKISEKPDKWRLGNLLFLSSVFGLMLMASSFAHLLIANLVFRYPMAGWDVPVPYNGNTRIPTALDTIMYLQISSCPHFVIFSSRVPCYWWQSLPSLVFFTAIIGTQIFAMVLSIVGDARGALQSAGIEPLFVGARIRLADGGPPVVPFYNPGRIDLADPAALQAWASRLPGHLPTYTSGDLPKVAAPIGVGWGLAIMAISFAWMTVMDVVKMWIYRNWTYELTVMLLPFPWRVRELRRRRAAKAASDLARHRWQSAAKLALVCVRRERLRGLIAQGEHVHVHVGG